MKDEFVDTISKTLSRAPLKESINKFNDVLRMEQFRRNAHILCLPMDVILLIIHYAEGNSIRTYKNIVKYLSIFGKDQLHLIRNDSLKLYYQWQKLKELCNFLIGYGNFPCIILATTHLPAAPHTGTSKGRHILSIVEDIHNWRLSVYAEQLVSSGEKMMISIHKCALVARHRENPYYGEEEYVSVVTNRVHKIWWVNFASLPLSKHIDVNFSHPCN